MSWLRSEQRALGYRVPFDLLATDPGADAVEDLLGRIEYGVIT
jgi:putative toxin-antitoxin system antitoxin component (TIGR02293 family)